MITDAQTNFVYFSGLLKTNPAYETFTQKLTSILSKYHISYEFLEGTNDIWCRDYMPLQVEKNKFIEYRYDPDYLQAKKWRSLKTYPDIVCNKLGLKTIKSDLIIDGGNVIKSENCVILTDKVIVENKLKYTRNQIVSLLKDIFEVETIVLIPWDKENEEFGHADGMIRFINENSVLINGYFKKYDLRFKDSFFGALKANNLEFVELNYNTSVAREELNLGYINYLQMKDLLLIPQFGIEEDEQALEQMKMIFPEYAEKEQIVTIDATSVIKEGGVLNCISWNIVQ